MTADNRAGGGCGTNSEPEVSDSLKTFGAVLKALRDEARLIHEQFAPLVQYSTAYIAKIEQRKRLPQRDPLDCSEEVLGAVAARVLVAAARSLTRKVGPASPRRLPADFLRVAGDGRDLTESPVSAPAPTPRPSRPPSPKPVRNDPPG